MMSDFPHASMIRRTSFHFQPRFVNRSTSEIFLQAEHQHSSRTEPFFFTRRERRALRQRCLARIARENGQRALVLSAFGCGAFRNPPRHMAELFRDELAAPEFRAAFDRVVFSVIDDHNARGEGNLRPFREVFA